MPYFLFYLLLLLLVLVGPSEALISCQKCDLPTDNCQYVRNTCKGDYCFNAQYYYANEVFPIQQKGCIIGEVVNEGCRVNHHGNIMCFCSTEQCNNVNITQSDIESIKLGVQTCQPMQVDNLPKPRWVKPCAGNYCSYSSGTANIGDVHNYTWTTKECNKENEFDIFPTSTIFNFYAGTCVWLEYGGEPSLKACYGSDDIDTSLSVPEESEDYIECVVDYFSPKLPYVKSGSSCTGQFCFISATSRGEVYRGCVRSVTVEGSTPLKIGYTRSFSGLEQWLCDKPYCNTDLKSAESSWPPELYLYRNISYLREYNVFFIDSSDAPTIFLTFLLIITCHLLF